MKGSNSNKVERYKAK